MATLSHDHLPQAVDSKLDSKVEDEQVEHGNAVVHSFIETKYAGECKAVHSGKSLMTYKIWDEREQQKSSGEQCSSVPFCYGRD